MFQVLSFMLRFLAAVQPETLNLKPETHDPRSQKPTTRYDGAALSPERRVLDFIGSVTLCAGIDAVSQNSGW